MSQAQYPSSSGYTYGPGQGYQQNYQQPVAGQPRVGFAPQHEGYRPSVNQQGPGPLSSQQLGGMQGQSYGSFHGSFSGRIDCQDAPPPSAPPADMFPHLAGYEDVQFGSAFIRPPPAYVPPSYSEAPEQRFAQSASISAEQAHDAMLQFVSEHCCYGKTPAREMAIRDIFPSSSYHYSLTSFCESRKTEWKYAPYQGQPIDSPVNGPAPLPWDIPLQPPQMFSDFKTAVEVPHTANIKPCHDCFATGSRTRTCPSRRCGGTGRMQCRACDGSGRATSLDTQCTNCKGRGVIVCEMCKGVGRATCGTCNGHAQLKTFIEMTVKWENHTSNHVVGQTGLVPVELIVNSQGTEIFSEELPRVWPITNFFDQQVNAGSKRLVVEHTTKWPTQRIIRQRQFLQAVPVSEVHYEWMDTPRRFWVFGHDHKVYAPDYPQRYCCGCSIL